MIKRETYMSRIRPFMNQNIVKVLTGIRRSGKSVMLDLIREEICLKGVSERQFLSVNLESRNNSFESSINGIYDHIKKFCLLHNRITQSCKVKTDIVASPFWTKLQTLVQRLSGTV